MTFLLSGGSYKTIDEVAKALMARELKGALIDQFVAAGRSDLFKHPDIIAKQIIRYPAAYGVVLAGDMVNVRGKFIDCLTVNSAEITKMIERTTPELKVL